MMKKIFTFFALLLGIVISANAQGPNRTFGKFKKIKKDTELTCTENCATIILAYEKGTYINSVKAAIGIDEKFAIAADKGTYIEFKINPGNHIVSLAQGVNDGGNIFKMKECSSDYENFTAIESMFTDVENYKIHFSKDISDLKFNLNDVPYTNKMFAHQINYLTYKKEFKAGETYYFKSIRIANGVSLACGPIVSETSKEDFDRIKSSKKIKGSGEYILYKASK